jgi:hypothetical protein
MSIQQPTSLTPELLLWEVGAILARHGIPYATSNPTAAVHAATLLLRALGLTVAAEPPAALPAGPAVPDAPTATLPAVRWDSLTSALPRRDDVPPRFARGQHRPGAERSLRVVEEVHGGA